MNILILGSGGREHALAWKLSKSPGLKQLFIAPGNGGTRLHGENVKLDTSDHAQVKNFVLSKNIDMVVVGPEAPLVAGFRDSFEADPDLRQIPVIGPDSHGARLEGSKDFAKDFMLRHGIPTAAYKTFVAGEEAQAAEFMRGMKPPYVLKADGLAAGKGVLIIDDLEEAVRALKEMFSGKFGDAGRRVVIEEHLKGIELSVFMLCDGKDYIMLPEAKDYKRIGEGDTGLNTGGMGAVSPVPFAGKDFLKKVEERVVVPTMNGLMKDGIDYLGFIFIGLMNCDGEPKVIEYNVRLGDPEAEVIIPRIKSDLLDVFKRVADRRLAGYKLEVSDETATTVMLVSGGYPEDYEKGMEISGTENAGEVVLFHAGTELRDGKLLTSGGRVMAVTATGETMQDALGKSFSGAARVRFSNSYYRRDIGFDL